MTQFRTSLSFWADGLLCLKYILVLKQKHRTEGGCTFFPLPVKQALSPQMYHDAVKSVVIAFYREPQGTLGSANMTLIPNTTRYAQSDISLSVVGPGGISLCTHISRWLNKNLAK